MSSPEPAEPTSPEPLPRRTARVLDAVARTVDPPAPFTPFVVPTQRTRRRAPDPGRHRALPPPPDLWTPPPGAPVCTCGMALRPRDDACTVCGLARPSGLLGVLGLTGRHWLSGPRRR